MDNSTIEDVPKSCAFGVLIEEQRVLIFCILIISLILGLPLQWNILWNLRVRLLNKKKIGFYSTLS